MKKLEELWRLFEQYLHQKQENMQLQEYQYKKERLDCCVWDIMSQCAIELFDALDSQSYPAIKPLRNPRSIRIVDYRIVKGQVLYCFAMTKQNPDRTPAIVLSELTAQMNRDIANYRYFLSKQQGEMIQVCCPVMASGLRILSAKDIGFEILIVVNAGCQPILGQCCIKN